MLTVNWLLTEVTDPDMTLGLSILSHILIETPASPLRKALIDSGLGEDLAGNGLESDTRQLYFSTGLKGIALEDGDRIEWLITDTLRQLAEEGIEQEMIEASLNTVEFALRENNTGSYPRGLSLMIRALRTWIHGADPLSLLAFETPLAAIKGRIIAGESYFEELIRDYFLNNSHRTIITMKPDSGQRQHDEAEEQERLAQARASMTDDDLRRVLEDTQKLKLMQETPDSPEALATIPTLTLEDLDRENKLIPLSIRQGHNSTILVHDLFTNGIVYLDIGFNLYTLPQEYIPYLALFGRALLEMGTQTMDFVKLSQRIGRKTGGIEPSTFTSAVGKTADATAWLFLRGKSTTTQAGDMLAILRDVLLTANLDNRERFRQLVLEEKASAEARLVPAGHLFIWTRLKAHFHEADWASEQMGGVSNLLFLRQLADDVDNNWPSVLDKLETIRRLLINRSTMISNVTLDEQHWIQFEPLLINFLAEIPAREPSLVRWNPDFVCENEGLSIPAQVNYVGKGANLYQLGYQPHGSISLISAYLRATWLWERVRVHGGAYGGFSAFDPQTGTFGFLSYRDPNLLDTIDVYDQTSQYLRGLELGQDELVKAIIGAIGDMDSYQLPDAKGYTSMLRYLSGITDEERQRRRDEILNTTEDDFKRLADALEQLNQTGCVVVLGSADAIEAANMARGGDWLHTMKVL
jgi:Zn-dependent M16 (insulinase) family peptidase